MCRVTLQATPESYRSHCVGTSRKARQFNVNGADWRQGQTCLPDLLRGGVGWLTDVLTASLRRLNGVGNTMVLL